jgi:hypothetical protein
MTTDHKKVRLVLFTGTAMSALLAEDLRAARAEVGVELGELFVDHHSKRLWQYRVRPTRPRSPPSRASGSSRSASNGTRRTAWNSSSSAAPTGYLTLDDRL